ncbi:hypothetical protein V8C42DRAFT_352017 [Trichoderma barbatum]
MAETIRMNLQPAPYPVLFAAGFPRVHAEDFPHGDRAAFTKYYPYGLPVTYKMMHGVHSHGVAQTYLEDNLPVGFYTNVPSKAKAFISTSNGSRPFRTLDHILPQRRIHLWSRDDIQRICNSLRKKYWNELKHMQQPYCWDDLWTYFDAHDLYHNGCMNLWNVINTLWDENKFISMDVKREVAVYIGHWADDWLKRPQNREKLTKWEETCGPIFRILDDEDHKSLGLIHDDVVPLIASALRGRRTFLLTNKGTEQVEEPADLMTACRTNSVENWLTGQRVFDNNGLPPPPVSEPHRSSLSMNEPTPCIVQNGKHYFLPYNCFPLPESPNKSTQALEALQKSAKAVTPWTAPSRPRELTKPGVVIVNGSNMPEQLQSSVKKTDKKKAGELQSHNDPRRISSMPETSSPEAAQGSSLDMGHSTKLATGNGVTAATEARRSSESASLSTCGKSPDYSLSSNQAGGETMIDKLTREVAELERTEQKIASVDQQYDQKEILYPGPAQQLEGRVHPAGEGQVSQNEATRLEHGQTQCTDGPLNDPTAMRQLHLSQRARRLTQDKRQLVEDSSGDFRRQIITTSHMESSPEPTPFYMQPDKTLMPHFASTNGFPHQSSHLYPATNRPLHPTPYREFSGASQVVHLQQPTSGTQPAAIPASKMRNIASGEPDENTQLVQLTRPELLHGSSTTSLQNGYRNGSRAHEKVEQRRGSQGQKPHGWNPGQQAQLVHRSTPHESYLNKSWRRGDQPDRNRQSSWCLNPIGANNVEYNDCTCSGCNERNRSIWVRVCSESSPLTTNMDIQTFLKFGIGSRFGQVEEAFPTASQSKDAFIVRFAKESSVPQALAFGGGMLAEKGIKINIRPTHRSKWVKFHQQQHTRRLPLLPIAHQPPMWAASAISIDYTQVTAHSPSLAATPTHTPERGRLGTSSSRKSTEILLEATVLDQSVAQKIALPAVEPTSGTPDSDQSRRILEFTQDHDRAASVREDKHQKPEQTSARATISVQNQKTKKKEVTPQSQPLLEETAGERDVDCSKTTPGCEGSRYSLPKKARVALPNSPLKSTSVTTEVSKANVSIAPRADTGDGSYTPKSQERQVKQASTPGETSQSSNASITDAVMRDDASMTKRRLLVSSGLKKTPDSAPEVAAELPLAAKNPENIFTEDEIKERKQAWNRISMPLDPRKSKKLGTSVISGPPPMPQAQIDRSSNVAESTRVSIPSNEEQAQIDSSEVAGVGKINPKQSMERIEDGAQQHVKNGSSGFEQRPFVSNGLPKAEFINEEDSCSSKLASSEPSQCVSEQPVEDTAITPGTMLSTNDNEASALANNQSKPKGKWNKNKKAKKRLASAPPIALQKESDSQEMSPSDWEISAICLKEKTQYPYDTLPRGRPDFRNNAGGSLKVPKKRKSKYPAITSKTFEASTAGKFAPSQSRYVAGGPMTTIGTDGKSATVSTTHAGESDPSIKSRLNPLATSFESPRKENAMAIGDETGPYSPRAASSRAGPGEISLGKTQSPSKFKIILRPMTTHDSPSKAPQLREKSSQGFKEAEISTKQQEPGCNEVQRDWSKERLQRERENIKLANLNNTSPAKDEGKTKADLDAQDWPALPVSRVRSATLQ